MAWLEIGEAVEVTITADVTTITLAVEVTAETKVKVDSIVEVVVVANTAVDTKINTCHNSLCRKRFEKYSKRTRVFVDQ